MARGKRAWYDAMRGDLPSDTAGPDFARVYRERFGHDIPRLEPAPATVDDDPRWRDDVWELMDALRVGMPLAEGLDARTRSELVNLFAALSAVLDDLATRAGATFGADPNASDWHLWADWIVREGRDACEEHLARPDLPPPALPAGARFVGEDFFEIYYARFGAPPRVG